MRIATLLKRGRLGVAASSLALVLVTSAAVLPKPHKLTVVLAGQSMIRADTRLYAPAAVPAISPLLKGDVVFTNFEATVAKKGQPNEMAPQHGHSIAPPGAMEVLKAMGFNMLALSDNHSWDLGVPGIQNTIQEANRLGIVHAGTGDTLEQAAAPAYMRTPNGTVALVAMASGFIKPGASATADRPGVDELRVGPGNVPNPEDEQRILRSIREASQKADVVIVYQHNHVYDRPFMEMFAEEMPERLVPPDWIRKWTHEEIDAGADIVVMHGAPVVQGVEIYRNRPIFYDLGNFVFNLPLTEAEQLLEPIVWQSVVATVQFQEKHLVSIEFRPVVLNQMGRGEVNTADTQTYSTPESPRPFIATRGLPTPATGYQAHYILERLADSSRAMGTSVEVTGDTAQLILKRPH
ncbi:MAG TPA: CapA family protein [Candidatus Dormibacteraeota bacterium]|nr:CapA family protein [Candidatus Dormibacteraeota bacterium]